MPIDTSTTKKVRL